MSLPATHAQPRITAEARRITPRAMQRPAPPTHPANRCGSLANMMAQMHSSVPRYPSVSVWCSAMMYAFSTHSMLGSVPPKMPPRTICSGSSAVPIYMCMALSVKPCTLKREKERGEEIGRGGASSDEE